MTGGSGGLGFHNDCGRIRRASMDMGDRIERTLKKIQFYDQIRVAA